LAPVFQRYLEPQGASPRDQTRDGVTAPKNLEILGDWRKREDVTEKGTSRLTNGENHREYGHVTASPLSLEEAKREVVEL
jgi:hypothetical protein